MPYREEGSGVSAHEPGDWKRIAVDAVSVCAGHIPGKGEGSAPFLGAENSIPGLRTGTEERAVGTRPAWKVCPAHTSLAESGRAGMAESSGLSGMEEALLLRRSVADGPDMPFFSSSRPVGHFLLNSVAKCYNLLENGKRADSVQGINTLSQHQKDRI